MRKKVKIVEGMGASIKVPDGKRDIIIFDELLTGFFLRVYANGRVNYGVDYYVDGKRRRMTLGPAGKGQLAQARKSAGDIIAKARLGDDALGERQENKKRNLDNLQSLFDDYLQDAEKRLAPRTYSEFFRHMNKHLKPLHSMSVGEIQRKDISMQIDRIAEENGPVVADHCRATLSTFFAWCIERQYCDANASSGIARRSKNSSRNRI